MRLSMGVAEFLSADDGFDLIGSYQMIRMGNTISMGFMAINCPEGCVLKVAHKSIAEIYGLYTVTGTADIADGDVTLGNTTSVRFFIKGSAPGATSIDVWSGGKIIQKLSISVKTKRIVTYRIYNVTDPLRPPREGVLSYLQRVGKLVESYFLRRANVEMILVDTIANIKCKTVLKWPGSYDISQGDISEAPIDLGLAKNRFSIFDASPRKISDVLIFNAWKITEFDPDNRYIDPNLGLLGLSPRGISFCQDAMPSDEMIQSLFCHEIAHALGLKHFLDLDSRTIQIPGNSNAFVQGFLMWPAIGGLRLAGFETDFLNPSGRVFTQYY